jgi:hypothetical protein
MKRIDAGHFGAETASAAGGQTMSTKATLYLDEKVFR